MYRLVIKGDEHRGSEVIALLEMLGGKNLANYQGDSNMSYYAVNGEAIVAYNSVTSNGIFKPYALDAFLEQYPYKIGDFVETKNGSFGKIIKMDWDGDTVLYTIMDKDEYTFKCSTEKIKSIAKEEETENVEDKTIIMPIPTGYKFSCIDEKQQIIFEKIEPTYPTTLEECLDILGIQDNSLGCSGYDNELFNNLQMLKVCRDAFYKVDKVDFIDYTDKKSKYAIVYEAGNIYITESCRMNHFLTFYKKSTCEKMLRDFKDLITKCKIFL